MKKSLLLLLAACGLQLSAFSQNVGIGTTNPLNKLHVAGGFRLDTLANNVDSGLLRHNKNGVVYSLKFSGNVNDVLRGDGTFGNGGSGGGSNNAFWSLTGNAGTDETNNFIGTTDLKTLSFRINNQPAGKIDFTNTVFGYKGFYSNTFGDYNIASGFQSLYSNTIGDYNTALGSYALYSNTTADKNTATGAYALYSNTTGTNNVANGYTSLYSNTTGNENIASGVSALYSNTGGVRNTANGKESLYSNTTGSGNVAVGFRALYVNSIGQDNVACGDEALYNNSSGQYNVGIGSAALGSTTTSYYNTAIGFYAGGGYNNGYNNVFVGANTNVNANDYYNVIAIGQGTVCTDVSQVTIGNSATTAYRAYANWSNISDGNFKKDVREDVPGLAFIKKLRPVTYTLDATGLDDFLHKNIPAKNQTNDKAKEVMNKALKEKEQIRLTGFVAQEVEKSAKELGFNFSGVDAPKNKNDVYGLRYAEFVVPLVKAVQEQQAIIEKQQQQIDKLMKEMQLIKEKIK